MVKISRRSDGGKSTKMSFKNVRYGSQKTVSKNLNSIVFIVLQYFSELYVYNLDRFLPFFVSNLRHKLLATN